MAPLKSTLGAASAFGWLSKAFVTVSGGTLTADETYYYRTFTDTSQVQNLVVEGGSLQMDFVVVGAGGGMVANISSRTITYNCYYHSGQWVFQGDCGYWGGVYPGGACTYCYYEPAYGANICYYQWNYYCDNSWTYNYSSGAGGGGGVVTGSVKVRPGTHPAYVGGGSVSFNGESTKTSSIFGIRAYEGQTNGSPTTKYGSSSGVPMLGVTNPSMGATAEAASGPNTANYVQPTNAVPAQVQEEYTYLNRGNTGGGNVWPGNKPNASNFRTLNDYANNNMFYGPDTVDVLSSGGWGGGAGYYAFDKDNATMPYWKYDQYNAVLDGYTAQTAAPNDISLRQVQRDAAGGYVDYTQYTGVYGALSSSGYNGKVIIYNALHGAGVEALGLKVGGGGQTSAAGRFESYGGGYPTEATTVQNGRALTGYGVPNTGGGAGIPGTAGGSGVIRVRYLRSAVGG